MQGKREKDWQKDVGLRKIGQGNAPIMLRYGRSKAMQKERVEKMAEEKFHLLPNFPPQSKKGIKGLTFGKIWSAKFSTDLPMFPSFTPNFPEWTA